MAQKSLPPETAKRRYAVIGAGASGLCCAKHLKEAGFEDVTIFEVGTQIGGLWCFENDSKLSTSYRTLHINSPKKITNFHDFKFRDDIQMFPDVRDMHEYLIAYARYFDLVKHIRFRSRVTAVRPAAGDRPDQPKWEVVIEDGRTETFDRVVVANGHLSKPRHVEEFQEKFAGQYMHSSSYREPNAFVGKRVCIVGVGNSACDIASDICMTSARTVLVARSGVVISPKTICGVPFHDFNLMIQKRWIPRWLRRKLLGFLVYVIHGSMADLGFKPLTKQAHGTSNPVLVQHIKYRRISVKQGIEAIERRTIRFLDGTSDEFDILVVATGYLIDLPFLSADLSPVQSSGVELYKRIVPPDWRGLYFIGLLNVGTVSHFDAYEHQMRWLLAYETGEAVFPSPDEMRTDIARKRELIARTYTASPRHMIEEHPVIYYPELTQARKEGQQRMRQFSR